MSEQHDPFADEFNQALEHSSLGTPNARTIQAKTNPLVADLAHMIRINRQDATTSE